MTLQFINMHLYPASINLWNFRITAILLQISLVNALTLDDKPRVYF